MKKIITSIFIAFMMIITIIPVNALEENMSIEYLPIGDDDKYDWQCDEISESELYDIISKKIESKEQIGVNLFYCNGTEGISLMAYNTSQTILSITINRKTVKGKYTDMSWYLENIVYKLLNADVRLLSYKIEEYED